MLRSAKDLEYYTIHAADGSIGQVKDFYFDDKAWVIRYLVVDTGTWLSSRKVLISPIGIGHPGWAQKILPVSITKEQVKNSPYIDTDRPVSRHDQLPGIRRVRADRQQGAGCARRGENAAAPVLHRGRLRSPRQLGVPMSRRSGDLDPGLVSYLARTENMSAKQFNELINFQSGLLGVSETSSDMRDLLKCEAKDVRAA